MRDPLPIDEVLETIAGHVRDDGGCVVVAPPGSGKTTRVPPALLPAVDGRIVVLQPRRVATRAAARRVAQERGEALGGAVGFQVRGERRASASTRVLYVTEGILVRMLQDDPLLDGVGAVILDEFHERSLQADLALAMSRHVRREVRPDLAMVVMSATLDPGPVAAFLDGAPVVQAGGRAHPVQTEYRERSGPRTLARDVAAGVRRALDAARGDVLAFLPGVGEIHRTADELLRGGLPAGVELHRLYGALAAAKQDAVLARSRARRVILSTNVAETSLTVAGVDAVVDGGLARVLRHDLAVGLDRLELERISRASADQRAGRAGRTGPGWCFRAYGEGEAAQMAPAQDPEIARVDLAGPVLQLLAWGEDPASFGWFEAPDPDALVRARTVLAQLGALRRGQVTARGKKMAALPLHPRLAALVLEGRRRGYGGAACRVAALVAERPLIRRQAVGRFGDDPDGPRWRSRSDVLDRLAAVQHLEDPAIPSPFRDDEVHVAVARRVLSEGRRLSSLLERGGGPRPAPTGDREEALLRAVAAAYPDRIGRRRDEGSPRGVLVGGRGVRLAEDSAVTDDALFVAVDVAAGRRGARSESVVRMASGVDPAWLPEHGLSVERRVIFDEELEKVRSLERTRYLDLELHERPASAPDAEAAAVALEEAARRDPARALGLDSSRRAGLLARWRFLRGAMPELALPDPDAILVEDALPLLCAGRSSFAELRAAKVLGTLLGLMPHRARAALDREAPERLALPSGHHARVQYPTEGPPVLAAKIQDLFGWTETPRVAAGRVPLMLHLLAPNGRPQQVTQDLRSFWDNTYPEVRKELRARYSKHAWPEKP